VSWPTCTCIAAGARSSFKRILISVRCATRAQITRYAVCPSPPSCRWSAHSLTLTPPPPDTQTQMWQCNLAAASDLGHFGSPPVLLRDASGKFRAGANKRQWNRDCLPSCSNGRECTVCGFCAACSCACHTYFDPRYRFDPPEALAELSAIVNHVLAGGEFPDFVGARGLSAAR
jgi:hypothetical protein